MPDDDLSIGPTVLAPGAGDDPGAGEGREPFLPRKIPLQGQGLVENRQRDVDDVDARGVGPFEDGKGGRVVEPPHEVRVEVLLDEPGELFPAGEGVERAEPEVKEVGGCLAVALEEGFQGLPGREFTPDEEDVPLPAKLRRVCRTRRPAEEFPHFLGVDDHGALNPCDVQRATCDVRRKNGLMR